MTPAPYPLVCAVQDLHDLYQRVNPIGPYRLELFHDAEPRARQLPAVLGDLALELDLMIRGISCLLANNLEKPAIPLINHAWKLVRQASRSVGQDGSKEPPYYGYLTQDLRDLLDMPGSGSCLRTGPVIEARIYQLFGEVLAVYLDLLDLLRLKGSESIEPRVDALRALIAQSGSSSDSTSSSSS